MESSSSSSKDSMAHHEETHSFWQTAKSFFFPPQINLSKTHHKTTKTDETRRPSPPHVDKMYMYSFGSINMP